MTLGYIDWNSHLLSDAHDIAEDPKKTIFALSYLYDRFQIDTFSMMPTFHSRIDSVSSFLIRRDKAIHGLMEASASTQSPIKILSGASVMLDEGLYEIQNLKKLTVPFGINRYLPLQLPISEHADWIDYELNRILYRADLKILFLSFETCCILYPESVIEKFTRISNSIYQFSYQSITNPKIRRVMAMLLHQNSTVLLGTSLNFSEKVYHYDFQYYLDTAKEYFSAADYAVLMKSNQRLPHKHAKLHLLG